MFASAGPWARQSALAASSRPYRTDCIIDLLGRTSRSWICPLGRAFADIAFRDGGFRVGRGDAGTVEQHRNLVGMAELAIGTTPLVQDPEYVPFVVRASAHRRRRPQRVIAPETRFGKPACRGLLEFRVRLHPVVVKRIELRHVGIAIEFEIAGEVLRPREIDEIEVAGAVLAL